MYGAMVLSAAPEDRGAERRHEEELAAAVDRQHYNECGGRLEGGIGRITAPSNKL